MGFVLDERPQMYPQQRHRSAWGWTGPTGLVGVHSAESVIDRIFPDTGPENVANFIVSRRDPGGYHVLVGSDSYVRMARSSMMTWHIAADNLNGPAWGISFACRSTDFNPDEAWTQESIATAGVLIVEFWDEIGVDPATAARWLTRAQVGAAGGRIAGLVHHGTVQPGDRSDAWVSHPRRDELDAMLIEAILNPSGNPQPIPPSGATMNDADLLQEFTHVTDRTKLIVRAELTARIGTTMGRDPRDGKVYEFERPGLHKRYVTGPAEFDQLAFFGVPWVGDLPVVLIDSRITVPEAYTGPILAWAEEEVVARLVEIQKVIDLDPDDQAALAALNGDT